MRTSTLALVPAAALLGLLAVHCGSGSSDTAPPGTQENPDGSTNPGHGHDGGTTTPPGSDAGVGPGTPDAWVAPDVGSPVDAGSPGTVDIHFVVHTDQKVHAISPYIYGVNDGSQAKAAGATIVRNGGNRLTAYNWENNASNAGSDYQFENDDFLCSTVTCTPTTDTSGAYLTAIVAEATAAGAATIVTVPIVDYVAADKSPAGDVRNSGSNYLSTRFKQNKATKGAAFAYPPNTTDAYVYQDEMVSWIKSSQPNATLWFQLDNEPDLWSGTHAEVHPVAVTYAELAQRDIEYATAIKAVAPGSPVIGPVNYGWAGYVNLQSATDSAADGDFIEWWLSQMKAAEATAGKRLVDNLDLHWYPEATGGGNRITDTGTSAAESAAREQAPRSLWDATYVEDSWITQDSTGGKGIDLIPLMMGKIASKYPGTGLTFTEWNYGAGGDISGAIASADVLGIFGAYSVTMASMWPSADESFTYAAFTAYTNYDGTGKSFGDTSVSATTDDVPDSSVYAGLASSDTTKLVLVAINKALTTKVAGLQIFHSTVYSKANVFTLTTAGGKKMVAGAGLTAVAENAFDYTMPAQSVSVIELVQ